MWRNIPTAPGYEVTSEGQVRNAKTGKIKKTTTSTIGYLVFGAYIDGKWKTIYLHHAVCEAFLGPRPVGSCVNHKDGDKANPRLENLEYVTQKQNIHHAIDTGLFNPCGEANGHAKLTEHQVRQIRSLAQGGQSTTSLSAMFNVGLPIISQIKHGSRWKHLL